MSEEFHELIQTLGEAINEAVTESEGVNTALERIRESGVDVFLVLEATICVRRQDGEAVPNPVRALEPIPVQEEDFDVTPEDRNFLKRLRIKVSDEE